MRLFALSDLHLGYEENRRVLASIAPRPHDWMILAGDVGETLDHLDLALRTLTPRFQRIVWTPGNHELWTIPTDGSARGRSKYDQLVQLCRSYGALTPEDPYPIVRFGGRPTRIAPLFLLYDYTFRPDDVPVERALEWARAGGVECADERLLHPDPYPSRQDWCAARCAETEARLEAAGSDVPTVLVNHFPLLQELAHLPRVPRFTPWCGTRRTADWHRRFGVEVVVYGHLHIPSTKHIDGTRFEEVSLGYPKQWSGRGPAANRVREILPA
jgi:3',5'-cyclic AMP phosphodiesterase CpdA